MEKVNKSQKEENYWVNDAKYDWLKARNQGNLFEKFFYNLRINKILSLTDFTNKNILDMGCGTGVNTYDFYKKSKKITGIDISPWAIKKAKKNFKEIPFYIRNSENTGFKDNSFDIVVYTGLIQYLKRPELTISEIFRILKPGGITIVDVPWKYSIYNSKVIRNLITGKMNPNDEPINNSYSSIMLRKYFKKFKCVKVKQLLFISLYGMFKKV